jgi:hypothetical protein
MPDVRVCVYELLTVGRSGYHQPSAGCGGAFMDRSDEFRSAAAECLALMHVTTDASSRARLLTMAQTCFAWSDGPYGAESLQDLLRDFNDQQMVPRESSSRN